MPWMADESVDKDELMERQFRRDQWRNPSAERVLIWEIRYLNTTLKALQELMKMGSSLRPDQMLTIFTHHYPGKPWNCQQIVDALKGMGWGRFMGDSWDCFHVNQMYDRYVSKIDKVEYGVPLQNFPDDFEVHHLYLTHESTGVMMMIRWPQRYAYTCNGDYHVFSIINPRHR
ncbi:unnamed protein product, partial [Mesorhabditis spiculigera]